MSLFTIGDLHLSFNCEKPMDIFSGWKNYTEKIKDNWENTVSENDTVIVVGDISWAMNLKQALSDFQFLENLPGKKIVLKGNHDYYWSTMKKMNDFLKENNLNTISILHNNSYQVEDYNIIGSRGWMLENESDFNKKIISREENRLKTSIQSIKSDGKETIAFLHYPPIFNNRSIDEFIDLLNHNNIKRCFYGHIHGNSGKFAPRGTIEGIYFQLVSCDYTEFTPIKIG